MHKGRGALAIAVALVMFLSALPFTAFESDAVPAGVDNNGVLLYEIGYKLPDGNGEFYDGVSVKNYGNTTVSLNGYSIVDKSGRNVSLSGSLAAGAFAVFVNSKVDDSWFCADGRDVRTCSLGSTFLNNGGDNVYLKDSSGTIIDVVSYGSIETPTTGWVGPAADGSTADQAIKRVEPTDTNTRFDWIATSGEHTSNGFREVPQFDDCIVEPFVFPDANGRPIFDAVMSADTSIHISIYMMTSDYMISLLANKASAGVDVKLLLENKPLGYTHPLEKLTAIEHAGGKVSFIGFDSDHDRYSYVHNKYAIIDGEKVVVTSENWTGTNLSNAGNKGNRGWGAVVTSSGYATYMETYFSNDWNGSDVGSFTEKVGSVTAWSGKKSDTQIEDYVDSLPYTKKVYEGASLKMYMSPDNTFKALQYYMDGAKERIYTEQMDIGVDFYNLSNETPLRWMKAAADRGVDSRFLIKDTEAEDFVNELNSETNIKASMMTNNGYSTMHNKGVIIDDCVWVSSVNWTMNAFVNNRECGLYIAHKGVADFYASEYMEDWDHDYDLEDTITIAPQLPAEGTESVSFTAKGISGTCVWTVVTEDGQTTKTTDSNVLTLESSDGLKRVSVTGPDNTSGRFVFENLLVVDTTNGYGGINAPYVPDDDPEIPVKTIAIAGATGAGILGFIILMLRRILSR